MNVKSAEIACLVVAAWTEFLIQEVAATDSRELN